MMPVEHREAAAARCQFPVTAITDAPPRNLETAKSCHKKRVPTGLWYGLGSRDEPRACLP